FRHSLYDTYTALFRSKFLPSEKAENEQFKQIVNRRKVGQYYPSFKIAEMVGLSGHALSRITPSFFVITSDNQKINLGLGLKFETKALKVVEYSRKDWALGV